MSLKCTGAVRSTVCASTLHTRLCKESMMNNPSTERLLASVVEPRLQCKLNKWHDSFLSSPINLTRQPDSLGLLRGRRYQGQAHLHLRSIGRRLGAPRRHPWAKNYFVNLLVHRSSLMPFDPPMRMNMTNSCRAVSHRITAAEPHPADASDTTDKL